MTYSHGVSRGYSPRSYYDYPPESYRHSQRSPFYTDDEPIRDDHPEDAYSLVKGHRHGNNDEHRGRRDHHHRHHHHDHGHRDHRHHRHHDHDHHDHRHHRHHHHHHHDRHHQDGHSNDPYHKIHLAEGAIAAAAAAELAHKYRKKEGEDVSSGWGHFARMAGAGALGAVAANEVSRVRHHDK